MKFKAIIFDMDGTIIDTEHIWPKANGEIIMRRGIEFDQKVKEELMSSLSGRSIRDCCMIIKEKFAFDDQIDDLIREKKEYVAKLLQTELQFIKGFTQFHQEVKQKEVAHGIATNADDQTIEIAKKSLNLEQYFGSHIYGISAVNDLAKPNPAIYLHAVDKLAVKPEECIAIEDSMSGIKAAKEAGMFCIGINTGGKPHLLTDSDHIVDGYHEIKMDDLSKRFKYFFTR